ncbi:hypothetical protein FNF29_00172 [Cafeteria roenbergensis]|uniref:Adenine DNA glycosylase n=1 Tax=Cafeteria roenbergensis TaxID=33653 RepID=A0A5A8CX62_CAFRO|nr:hypothetical protein FNF29_00172 [Cafeteria roenbergensis]|eukprot:KAA0157596.1 hypothetical protein FNF29_00172 [Cafeteria roenbergensis]
MFKPKAAAKPSEQDGKAADAAPAAPPVPRSGYATWVSEIMLQQTRVEAVIPHFLRWMERFPTAQSLADAPEEDAVALWAGLGYYRRARLLHKGARHVRDALGGQLPTTVEGLKEVPGIGDYTAGAVASIAFDKQAPIVDGNVIRVVARLAARPGAANDPDLKRYSWAVASALVPPAPARPAADNDEGRIGAAAGAAAASPAGRARADAEPIDPEGASADALQGDEERRAASQAAPGTAAAAAAEAAAPTRPKAEGDCPSPPGESVEAALRRPGAFNQALMELGATVCTPQTPDCAHCPYVFSGSTQQVSVHCEHWTIDSDAEPSVPRAEGDWRWVPLADLGQEALSSFAARALAAAIRSPLKGAAAPALGAHLRESGAKSVGTILGRAKLLTRAKKEGWWR